MAIHPNMVLDFAQNLGRTRPLTELGGQVSGLVTGVRNNRAYDQALAAYEESPSPQNLQALYRASVPVGKFDAVRAGYLDTLTEEGEAPEDLSMWRSEYNRYLDALLNDPGNPRIESALVGTSERLGNFDETKYLIEGIRNGMSPDMASLEAKRARYIELEQELPENYTSRGAMEYIRLAAELGFSEEEARQRMAWLRPEGVVDENLGPLPEEYTENRENWLANPFDPAAQVGALEGARIAEREGHVGEVASMQGQINLFNAVRENNPEMAERLSELIREFGETGNPQTRADAQLIAGQLGLGRDVELALAYHADNFAQRREQENTDRWNNALEEAIRRSMAGEIISPEERARLLNYGVAAGIASNENEMAQIFEEVRQERQQQIIQDDFDSAMENLYNNGLGGDNIARAYEAARAAGKVHEMEAELASMDTRERNAEFQPRMELIGALVNGNQQRAESELQRLINDYRAAGDMETAAELQGELDRVRNGQMNEVLGDYGLMLRMLNTDESNNVLEEIQRRDQNRRADEAAEREEQMNAVNIARIVSENPFVNEAEKEHFIEQAEILLGPLGREVGDLWLVRAEAGDTLSSQDATELFQSLRKEYRGYVEDFDTVLSSAQHIKDLVESGYSTGMLDAAILDYFNRVSNPSAVVRLSDVQRTQGAQAMVERIANIRSSLEAGTAFTDISRGQMLEVVEVIRQGTERLKQEQRGAIDSSLQRLTGGDREFLEQARREVFGPNGSGDREEEADVKDIFNVGGSR